MSIKPVQIKLLKRLLETGTDDQVIHAVERIHPSDISILFSELADEQIRRLLHCLLQVKKAGLTLLEIPEFFLPDILEIIEDEKLSDIISRLQSDDALYLLNKIPESRWHDILGTINPTKSLHLERLLIYPKYSAGSVMTSNYFAVQETSSVEDAIQKLRSHPEKEGVFYIYVVDGKRLVGVVPLRSMVLASSHVLLKDLMIKDVITVQAMEDQERAAQIVSQYNLLAIPVVSEQKELLGVITVDDVIDIFEAEATEDIYHMAGLSHQDRAFTPVFIKVKKRLPWILANLCFAFVSVFVISRFENIISQVAILAAYLPVVAALGGNCGSQSLIVITRSIALGEMEFSKSYRALSKEVLNGLVLGLVIGFFAGLIGYVLNGNFYFGVILFLSLVINMSLAGFMGTIIPLTLKRLKLDPAVGSGIFVTTFTDILGFFVFLGLATLFLKYLV